MTDKVCPSGKPCFGTKAEITDYIRKRNETYSGRSYRYYYCKECGCYHLTTRTIQGDYMLWKRSRKYDREKMRETMIFYREQYGF